MKYLLIITLFLLSFDSIAQKIDSAEIYKKFIYEYIDYIRKQGNSNSQFIVLDSKMSTALTSYYHLFYNDTLELKLKTSLLKCKNIDTRINNYHLPKALYNIKEISIFKVDSLSNSEINDSLLKIRLKNKKELRIIFFKEIYSDDDFVYLGCYLFKNEMKPRVKYLKIYQKINGKYILRKESFIA